MATNVRLSELATLPGPAKAERIHEMATAMNQPANGELAEMSDRIRTYENRYSVTTNEMREKVRSGEWRESTDLADWLFWADVRDRHARTTG